MGRLFATIAARVNLLPNGSNARGQYKQSGSVQQLREAVSGPGRSIFRGKGISCAARFLTGASCMRLTDPVLEAGMLRPFRPSWWISALRNRPGRA